jgi:hypothetical protein
MICCFLVLLAALISVGGCSTSPQPFETAYSAVGAVVK